MAKGQRKICLMFFAVKSYDSLTPFEQAFRQGGFDVEVIRIPNVWYPEFTIKYLRDLNSLVKKKQAEGCFVVFCPQSTELFLKEPDLSVVYSAYRSWFDERAMRVIPHLWTPVKPPSSFERIRWTRKPPLRVGFMGTSYATSRLVKLIMSSPKPVRLWLLQGYLVRHPEIIALLNKIKTVITFSAFPRVETLEILSASKQRYREIEFDITAKPQFGGQDNELNDYIAHLERCTYIVCPRGIENYSYRIYEALNRGRIPVIIDTDVVLPKEIDWDHLALKVPYESLNSLCDIILRDYHSRSDAEFMARQERAFATMTELQTMRWMKELASELDI